MSHVDEGQLHAYLDGGLSAMDAVRVERHLADCASCRTRLEEARGLVSRAAKLLEWASPPERAMPALADLPHAAPRWRTPVAWAATIVIALGVGVYGGGQYFKQRTTAAPAAPASERVEQRPVTAPPIAASVDTLRNLRDAERGAGTAVAPAPTATPATIAAAPREEDSLARQRVEVSADLAANTAPGRRDTSSTPPVALREQQSRIAPAPAAALGTSSDSGAAGLTPLAGRAAEFRRAEAVTSAWPIISRDSASRLLGSPIVALPDLPITAVRSQGDAVVVEHVVPPGQVIRLTQRRAAEAAKTGSESLARYVGGVRVEIAGPLAADSLSKLLERVRVVP